ncbi:MAG: hypothetical protein HRU72_09770 [Planctomycetia bacterium]|nr:MAG: hypothetical protein HRU72_09770 [Planctomycetia bacterium]HQU31994.1 hypothetical protein [Candidatus Brocadia sapporoensis]
MTKKEYAERNIGMTFDFIRQIIDHPEIIDTIPDNAELDFIDKNMPIKTKGRGGKRNIVRYKVERVFELVKE